MRQAVAHRRIRALGHPAASRIYRRCGSSRDTWGEGLPGLPRPMLAHVECAPYVRPVRRWEPALTHSVIPPPTSGAGGRLNTCSLKSPRRSQAHKRRFRPFFICTRCHKAQQGPFQLDQFVPWEYGYEFKAIITNNDLDARAVGSISRGRELAGTSLFRTEGRLSSGVPTSAVSARQPNISGRVVCAHFYTQTPDANHLHEGPHHLGTRLLWLFEQLDTLRRTISYRARCLTKPRGILHLTMNTAAALKNVCSPHSPP